MLMTPAMPVGKAAPSSSSRMVGERGAGRWNRDQIPIEIGLSQFFGRSRIDAGNDTDAGRFEGVSGTFPNSADDRDLDSVLDQPSRAHSRFVFRSVRDLDLTDDQTRFIHVDESELVTAPEMRTEDTVVDGNADAHKASVVWAEKMGEDLSSPGAGLLNRRTLVVGPALSKFALFVPSLKNVIPCCKSPERVFSMSAILQYLTK